MVDFEKLIVALVKFNEKHPEHNGYAFLKFYDDKSGAVYSQEDGNNEFGYLLEFDELLNEYQ